MPRRARQYQLSQSENRCYHVICRVTKQQYWLKDYRAKEVLRRQLWQVAYFCGVDVLGYCWMDNHIHLLIRVPPVREVSNETLVKRCKRLYGAHSFKASRIEMILERNDCESALLRTELLSRMHNLSIFVKEWKQRFAIWHNRAHQTFGTLWSERFKSLVVQDDPHVLKTVSAYIHLNPIRAGIVGKPSQFAFSLYGEVCKWNDSRNSEAIAAFCDLMQAKGKFIEQAKRGYLSYLKKLDGTIGDEFCLALKKPKGLPRSGGPEGLSNPLSMSAGLAVGNKAFVSEWLKA